MRRALLLTLVLVLGCGPKTRARGSGAVAAPVAPAREIVSDVAIDDGWVMDAAHRWKAPVPAGWTAASRFRADASGPEAAGELRIRLEEHVARCVIDVAIDSSFDTRDPRRSITGGREVFFFSETGAPRPEELAVVRVFAATTTPPDPTCVDVGYWLDLGDGRAMRVEGRFPVAVVVDCKAKLDDLVRSLKRIGPALEPAAGLEIGDGG